MIYIVTRSLEQGRSAGLVSMLGIQTGALVHALAAMVGLSALLASSATAFAVVKYAGAAYLIATAQPLTANITMIVQFLNEPARRRLMIARVWEGVVQRTDADAYADYIRETGFAEYAETAGNRGAWLLRRNDGERTTFITLSLWDSADAIRAFAGDDIEAAVLYPEDERYLVGDSTITHYEVADCVSP